MIESIAAGLGGKIAARWAALLLSPTFGFWALGAAAWIWASPHAASAAVADLAKLSSLAQGLLCVGALLIVVASGFAVERTSTTILRILQGYWPGPLRAKLAGRFKKRLKTDEDRWQKLYESWETGSATDTEEAGLLTVERRLAEFPAQPEQLMPTRLGNVVRAAESRPYHWYGLDAVRCWSRMWLVLPEPTKTEIGAARADLDTATTWWTWAALTVIWTVFTPWALLVALIGCWLSYQAIIAAAVRFGDLVDASFDLHRMLLYDALGWKRPVGAENERAQGKLLTETLWRGPA
jgi:hypothetical protein